MIIVDTWAFVCTLWLIVFDVLDTFTFEQMYKIPGMATERHTLEIYFRWGCFIKG